jgi:DNA polymerase delta subunit 1
MIHGHGFQPYFYVPTWPGFTQDDLQQFGGALNNALREQGREKGLLRFVMNISVVRKQSLWGYHFGQDHNFLQIFVAVPPLVATARGLLEKGLIVNGAPRSFQTYESNIPYALRYMIDSDMQGASWIELPAGSYSRSTKNESRAQVLYLFVLWQSS